MLMEQQFALRCGIGGTGELTLFEQNQMTAEERSWWYKRLEKATEERERAAQSRSQ